MRRLNNFRKTAIARLLIRLFGRERAKLILGTQRPPLLPMGTGKSLLLLERDPKDPYANYQEWKQYIKNELLPHRMRRATHGGPLTVEIHMVGANVIDSMIGMESALLEALEALKKTGGTR